MEFKVFKNENSKILKEYWLTQSEWDALDKTTVQEGDIYHIVGTIDKGDLSADVNASLAKGDSSLQKPTATLAKESLIAGRKNSWMVTYSFIGVFYGRAQMR